MVITSILSQSGTRGGRGGGSSGDAKRQQRPVILDLAKHSDKVVQVKLAGGRHVSGVLKGWDPLLNLVLDDAVEQLRDSADPYKLSGEERKLGLLVTRGPSVMTISPADGTQELIENPFLQENEQSE